MSKEKNYAVVVGGCNMDIQGKTLSDPVSNDSNPGTIRLSPGGVGRNIAENLARLQINTKLLSVLGDDANGHSILKDSKDAGIDMTHCLVLKNRTTSTYLSILNPQGGLEIALSDMSILEEMSEQVVDKNFQLIENSKLLVLDTNLPRSFLKSISSRFPTLPIYLDPVSGRKIGKIKGMLNSIHLLKPNRLETEQLTGFEIKKRSDLVKAASWILDQGVKEVVISLGKEG
ncbi:MAG: kinase, partial [Proteobacteria bacterium]|nr:kinase [Pseudomonadota bacterium]